MGEITVPVAKIDPHSDPDREIVYIDISGIDNQTNRIRETQSFSVAEAPSRARQILKSGDVLFSTVRPYLRNIAMVSPEFDGEIGSTGFCVLRPASGIEPKFLFFKAISKEFVDALSVEQYGVSYPAVKDAQVRAQPVVLPPTNEQRRIVEKIETLFARLDKGEEALREVQNLLARYRQSVLKAAVTGELTADWRAENAHHLEHGRDLLARILQTRREKWEGRGKYKEPAAPDTSGLPELPEGWIWTSVDQLCEPNRKIAYGVLQPGKQFDGGTKLVRVGDVNGGQVHLENLKQIDPKIAAKYPRTELQGHEVLVSLVGTIGRSAVVPSDIAGSNVARAVGMVPVFRKFVHPHWLAHCFNSPANSQKLVELSHEVARKTLNLEDVRSFQVPLPSFEEQNEIVDRLFLEMEKVRAAESQCKTELARSAALRQSILKDAFVGRLVPQEPGDEPATDLLARIKAERSKPISQPTRRISKSPNNRKGFSKEHRMVE